MTFSNSTPLSVIFPSRLEALCPAPIDDVAAAALLGRLLFAMRAPPQRTGGNRLLPPLPAQLCHVVGHQVAILRVYHGLFVGKGTNDGIKSRIIIKHSFGLMPMLPKNNLFEGRY